MFSVFYRSGHGFGYPGKSPGSRHGNYAAALDLEGYHDWRLPTLDERWDLLQVFVYKNNGEIEFPHLDSKYWTTDTAEGAQPVKLGITCMCRGDQEVEYKQNGYVWAVRGGKADAK